MGEETTFLNLQEILWYKSRSALPRFHRTIYWCISKDLAYRENKMKTTTFLVVAVVLLSFIVEESDGKITIALHNGRIRSLPKSRRRPVVKKRPLKTTKLEGNHTNRQEKRTRVVSYYLEVCFVNIRSINLLIHFAVFSVCLTLKQVWMN